MADDDVTQNDALEDGEDGEEGEEVTIQEDFQALTAGIVEVQGKFKAWANAAEKEKNYPVMLLYKRIAGEIIPLMIEMAGSTATGLTEIENGISELFEGEEGEEGPEGAEATPDEPGMVKLPVETVDALYRMCRTVRMFLDAAAQGGAFKGKPKAKTEAERLITLLMGIDTQGGGITAAPPAEGEAKTKEEYEAAFK